MGVVSLSTRVLVVLLGVLSLLGVADNDGQWQINRGKLNGWSSKQIIEAAVKYGDWKTAERIYTSEGKGVLGADTETDKMIWPEKEIEREIEYWGDLMKKTPSRYGFQKLSELYTRLGREAEATEALDKARDIDPNDVSVVGY